MDSDTPQTTEKRKDIPQTLKEEREKVTPGDAESWLNSDEESEEQEDVPSDEEGEGNIPNQAEYVVKGSKQNQSHLLEKLGLNEGECSNQVERMKLAEQMDIDDQQKYLTFKHSIDNNFAILLHRMRKSNYVNLSKLSGLKKGRVVLFAKGGQLIVKALSKEQGHGAIQKISDFIDDLNVIKLDMRPELAKKIQGFHLIKDQLKQKQIIMFGVSREKRSRQIFMGGLLKASELKKIHSDLKNYRLLNCGLKRLTNKRSYKVIMDVIFKNPYVCKQLMRFNKVNMVGVDYKSRDSGLRFYINILSKMDISPVQYDDFIMKLVKDFFVLTFVLQEQQFYQKLSIPEIPDIVFTVIRERRANLNYLMVICQRDLFFFESKRIAEEIGKVGDLIIGMRFFNHIEPSFRNFQYDSDSFIVRRFPKHNTYSMFLSAKVKEGKLFNWKQSFGLVVQLQGKLKEDQE